MNVYKTMLKPCLCFFLAQRELKECLTRALYCHLVGYDVSFAFFHAVKLATRNNVSEKIIGKIIFVFAFINKEIFVLIENLFRTISLI